MGENFDKIKGKVKEAIGSLTEDERTRREGELDKAKGETKEKLDRVAEAEHKPEDVKR